MPAICSPQLSSTADLQARVLVLAQRNAERRISRLYADDLARDVASGGGPNAPQQTQRDACRSIADARQRHEALGQLYPIGRRVYVLVCGDGLSVRACSLAQERPEQAVSFSLRAARRGLKEALRDLGVVTLGDVMPSVRYRAVVNTAPDGVADSPYALDQRTCSDA